MRGTLSQARRPREQRPKEGKQMPPLPKPGHITVDSGLPEPKWRRMLSTFGWFVADQWFLLALGCLVLIASQVQVPASRQGKKEIVVTYLCVAVIFLVTGCTLPTRVLMENYSRWKIHLFVQVQSFLMTSAVVYGVVSLCATSREFMDPGLLVGMIFTGCVPTTISSNIVMTRQAHGNTALTVVQSTLGNLLGPFLSPLLLQMYTVSNAWYTGILPKTDEGDYGEIYRRVFKQLGLSLFLPLVSSLLSMSTQTKRAKCHAGSGSGNTKRISKTDKKGARRLEAQQNRLIGTFGNHLANLRSSV